MKQIELEDDLYRYIASQTKDIGESASDILRRLLRISKHDLTSIEILPLASDAELDSKNTIASPVIIVADTKNTMTMSVMDNSSLITLPTTIAKLIKSNIFNNMTVSVTKFIYILSVLYIENPLDFSRATDIKGRKRIYFAKSESELLNAGSTTKPRRIDNTPYWVITNTNTGRKRTIVTQLMAEMGYSHARIDAVSKSI